MFGLLKNLVKRKNTHESAGLGGGGLVKLVVDVCAVAGGVDVGRDTDNGGGESEDGGELHFDRVPNTILVSASCCKNFGRWSRFSYKLKNLGNN